MKEADKDEDNFIDFEEFKQVRSSVCVLAVSGEGKTVGSLREEQVIRSSQFNL